MTAPDSHKLEAKKLQADGLVNLYEFRLRNSLAVLRFKDGPTLEWQEYPWESCPIKITGESSNADPQEVRPSLSFANPYGLFTPFILSGLIERAVIVRKRVLLQDLEEDNNVYEQRMWYLHRIKEFVSGQVVNCELRNMSEGPGFQIPVRAFQPPDFPTVSLK